MSTAIIKFKHDPKLLVYCNNASYPAGLGFDLLGLVDYLHENHDFWEDQSSRFSLVKEIPTDIQYEYIVDFGEKNVHCQECWFTADKNYHGGGFRHGGVYDLREWREKIRLQNMYTYRRPEAWNDESKESRNV